ncbi:MAG: mycothiol synthase [Actinomycetota bacterium]|nr:mycothiol synthase [Actinomycetota bacterium]
MSPSPHVVDLDTRPLTPAEQTRVDALVRAATTGDGVAPLSEQFLLRLRHSRGPRHLLAYAGEQLCGYAQLSDDPDPSAELVVDPAHRRSGVGSALLAALHTVDPDVRVWAHGDLSAAAAFAQARGLGVARELFVLERALGVDSGAPLAPVALPAGLHSRAFEPGRDEQEWLRVNTAAFVHHPEQGRLTRVDLDERMREGWFDAAGLVLVCPDDNDETVAASHWTKVHPAGEEGPDAVGEVYVVAVDPAYQGRGLGRPVTLLGLHHLEQVGLHTVILYVDGDNPAALTVYRSLGFGTRSVDRMYTRAGTRDGGTIAS